MLDSYLNLIHEDKELTNEVIGTGLLSVAVVAIAIIATSRKITSLLLTKKECRDYKMESPGWIICDNKVKIKNDKKKIDVMKSNIHFCKKSKDPVKCKEKVIENINKIQSKIKKREMRIKQLLKLGKK